MLRVHDLAYRRAERMLFSGLAFAVAAGQYLHIRGDNGIGKSSLLRVLAGLTQPEAGAVYWQERTLAQDLSNYHRASIYIGHKEALKEDFSALENLTLDLALAQVAVEESALLHALHTFGLRGREHLPVRTLSAGQKRRVALARVVVRPARLWLLDEPFNALDAAAVRILSNLMTQHLQGGGLLVLTSHQALPFAAPAGSELQL